MQKYFPQLANEDIESLFGFVEKSSLYGGRAFAQRELSDLNVKELNRSGIGLRIPLTNHDVSEREYKETIPILEKYNNGVNSVIVTNDELATWVKRDFPEYKLDASVIKNINAHDKINRALEIYDCVVLPMDLSLDLDFLDKITERERIILFANGGCALTCPSKMCYQSVSERNKFQGGEFRCSKHYKEREILGMIDFDLDPLIDLGYTKFKILRARPGNVTGV